LVLKYGFGVGLINGDIFIYSRLTPIEPRCHGNEIWDKIGYNLACVKNCCDIFAPMGGFMDEPSNVAN